MSAERRTWADLVMDDKLRFYQERLESHFKKLRKCRDKPYPVFGLEHGLDEQEVEHLSEEIRSHIAVYPPSPDHFLPWVVYTSEFGYRYSGEEYWQTFEKETPGWGKNGDRSWIRDKCYRYFHEEFCGAKPSGEWAKNFSIICWPITHAILPKDLQFHLARTLWRIRGLFSQEVLEAPDLLAEHIIGRSHDASSRFRTFIEQKQLVGQIAAPLLLLQEKLDTSDRILRSTLERIKRDIDSERRSRDWLKDAHRAAKRFHVKGLALPGETEHLPKDLDEAKEEVEKLGLEPRLLLKPEDTSEYSWTVWLEIPDLSCLIDRFPYPQIRDVLTGSRCEVSGSSGKPIARGRFLHGTQRVRLHRWPDADDVLLKFEHSSRELEYLLCTECLLRPRDRWLFRVASDGCAYECRGSLVRPEKRYVLVSVPGSTTSYDEKGSQAEILCEGMHGTILELPQSLDEDWEEYLEQVGLMQAKKIEFWPAGLGAVIWDGEGYAEWQAPERPCLAVYADHLANPITIDVEGETCSSLDLQLDPGEPVFIEFPQQLSVDERHVVKVSEWKGSAQQKTPLGEIVIRICSRKAVPKAPFRVQIDPPNPTLQDIWEGRYEVLILGPSGRKVKCQVSLFEEGNKTVSKELQLVLPVTEDGWRTHFEKFFLGSKDVQTAYHRTADLCELEFSADELGTFKIRCEAEWTPLRWKLRRRNQKYFLRLLDNTGDSGPPRVGHVKFKTPCVEKLLGCEFDDEVPVEDSGGMYVARGERFTTAIIVPPKTSGLKSLGSANVEIAENQARSLDTAIDTIKFAGLWGRAGLYGNPLVEKRRRRDITRVLIHKIFSHLCGSNWARAEKEFSKDTLDSLSKQIFGERDRIGAMLLGKISVFADRSCGKRVDLFAALAKKYGFLPPRPAFEDWDPEKFAELSLRLASDPAKAEVWAGENLNKSLKHIFDKTILTKAARFLVIATDLRSGKQVSNGEFYAGWRWA